MKHLILKAAAAALSAAVCTAALPAFANDALMQITLEAEQDACLTDALKTGDVVVHAGMYFRNYTGISSMRTILKSDDPLVIENGGFAWEEGQVDRQLRLVEAHTTAIFTTKSETTGASNAALFYANGSEVGKVAELRDPESPLVEFDVRIPQGTPAGDYQCYISNEVSVDNIGQTVEDFFCFRSNVEIYPGTDLELKPLVFSVYTRGDTDCSGEIEALDAQRALSVYLENFVVGNELSEEDLAEMIGTQHTRAAMLAMDINGNGTVEASDAQAILTYYLDGMLGNPQSWD